MIVLVKAHVVYIFINLYSKSPIIYYLFIFIQKDDTYETQSRISFVASRFENGEFITCEANNPVLEFYNEEPQRAAIALQVSCEYKLARFPIKLNRVEFV